MALEERDLVITHLENDTSAIDVEEKKDLLQRIAELKQDLEKTRHALKEHRHSATLVGSDGTEVEIPIPIYEVLLWVIDRMVEGKAFTLAAFDKELTTQQAADLLNVSRPFLIKLLNRGEIPYTRTGTHRRVKLQDVLNYREKRDQQRAQILRDMARDEKDWGL